MKYYSQTRQDFIVDQLFYKKKNGFFLDLGANDGISFSNTYFFEKTEIGKEYVLNLTKRFMIS